MRLIESFGGDQVAPGSEGYDEARKVFNAAIDKRPALIARCESVDDVARAIRHARDEGVEIAVRAAGHSVAGMSLVDDGLVIDVRAMNAVAVDPEHRMARAGAGATWSEFDHATQEHALATTGGRVSTTGIAGLTLGGGSGWLERSCGLACDNLVGAEMVTAGGEVVRAGRGQNEDLLWALRGGGGNFGVVTAMEFCLYPVGPMVFGGLAGWDPADAPAVARAFRDFHADGPDAAGLAMGYVTAPPEEFIPPGWQNRRVFMIAGLWNGPVEEGERALRGLLGARPAVIDLFGPVPYTALQSMIDDPPGNHHWWTADYLGDLPDAAIDTFCGYSDEMPPGVAQLLLVPWGGAVARGPGTGTPLAQRDAAWVVHPFGVWDDPARTAEHVAWGRRAHTTFEPWTTGGTYLNFVGDEGRDRVRAAFGDAYEELVDVKTQWDPENVFHGNQNIRPRSRTQVAAG
jgi:FAD/FMN-containing dehydrogenase